MKAVQLSNRLKIIEMIYRANESHLGSALSMVDIVEAVYQIKEERDKFVLSAGHTAAALYAVLDTHGFLKKPDLKKLENHPVRNAQNHIDVSTGSLGQGLPIAVGMALANRKKKVFCCISDGECDEGNALEALRIGAENKLTNLVLILNFNGFSAYKKADESKIKAIISALGWKIIDVDGHNLADLKKALSLKTTFPRLIFARTKVDQLKFLHGIDAHYYKMTEVDYREALKQWSKN